jgi:hypothetical protein
MAGSLATPESQARQSARQQHSQAAERDAVVVLNKALWCTPEK